MRLELKYNGQPSAPQTVDAYGSTLGERLAQTGESLLSDSYYTKSFKLFGPPEGKLPADRRFTVDSQASGKGDKSPAARLRRARQEPQN